MDNNERGTGWKLSGYLTMKLNGLGCIRDFFEVVAFLD